MAAALKVTPLIFLSYLLFKRRFTSAAVFAIVVIFLTLLPDVLLPPKQSWHAAIWVREVLLGPFLPDPGNTFQFWISDGPMNQSLRAAIARIIRAGDRSEEYEVAIRVMGSQGFATAVRVVTSLYVLGVGFLMLKSRPHDRLIAVDGSLLAISALMLSPVSSQSHFVTLMLPYAILAAALVKDRATRTTNAVVLLASFMLATATSNDLVGRSFTGWALWNSLPVLGTLVLIIQLGVLIWSVSSRQGELRSTS